MPNEQAGDGAIPESAGLETSLKTAVIAEQIRLLVDRRVDLFINVLVAGIVAATVGHLYPVWVMAAWLTLFCGVILARYLMRRRYKAVSPDVEATGGWGRIFVLGALSTACLWGITGSVVLVTPDANYLIFIVFVLGGMAAGGIVSNSAYMPSMLAFMLPTILPVVAILISRSDITHIEMGVMLALFAAVLFSAGRKINQSIIENFRMRIGQGISLSKIRASEAAMAEAQEISHVGSWEQDVRTGKIVLSAEMFRILGADPATLQATFEAIVERVHPDDRHIILKDYAKVKAEGTGSGIDHRIAMDDGTIRNVHEIVRTTYDGQGHPLRINGIVQDVTERKKAEAARALLAAMVDASFDAIVGEELDGTITSWNRGAERLFGYRADEVIGKSVRAIIPSDRRQEIDRNLRKIAAGELIEPFDTERQRKDGTRVAVSIAVSLVWDSAGRVAGASFISRDITERVQAAAALAYRDRLLHAVTAGAAILVKAVSIEDGMPEALRTVGESMKVDRVLVMQDCPGKMPPVVLRHVWQGPDVKVPLELSEPLVKILDMAEMAAWRRPLEDGKEVVAQLATSTGSVHTMLAHFRNESTLMVPIFVRGKLWGNLGADCCRVARDWEGNEIDVLKTFADFAGSLILHDETRRSLEFSNVLLKTQMEASPDGILVIDANRRIVSSNGRLAEIWAIPSAELTAGNDEPVLARVLALVKDPQKFLARVQYLYDHPGEEGHDDVETSDGRFIDRHSVSLSGAGGEIFGRAWFFRDITARKLAEAEALRMARYDGLTGLANRGVFVEAVQHAIAERSGKGFAVIYLDLDHFKDVNDTLGHPLGDALLQAVAGRLRASTRESDMVARFGGDEFAIIVADVREPADAAILAGKLIAALGDPYSIGGNQIYSSASIGIDLYGPEAPDAETLLSHADVALYRAKSEGRGEYRFFTDAMDKEVRMQVTLGTELHEALNSGTELHEALNSGNGLHTTAVNAGTELGKGLDSSQLFLLYQPQIATASGRITGVEAMVRWRHPTRGILTPEIFIPVAEKTGVMVKLGHWILLTACRDARARLDSGFPAIRTSANLSALQFKSANALESDIAAVLTETGLPARLLELELTETVLMDASREHRDIVARLRQIGVTIAIDEFGTGYSSLDRLRRFPADRIKIARTFVRELEAEAGDVAIVRATIGLARELGIMVTADGVETGEQFELLRKWGCDEVQGSYFAKPVSAEAVLVLLRKGGIVAPVARLVA